MLTLSKSDMMLFGTAMGLIVVSIIVYFILQKKRGKKKDLRKREKRKKLYCNIYGILSRNRFLKGYIHRMTYRFSSMSVYTRDEIQEGVAEYVIHAYVLLFAAFIVSCILFRDFPTVILCTCAAVLYSSVSIKRDLQKAYLKIYKQLKAGVSSILIEYKKSKDVKISIERATYGNRIAPIMEKLKHVIGSPDGAEALSQFYEEVPFKQVQTLAMICYNVNDTGDEQDEYDKSTFEETLLVMNSDLNAKIEELNYENMKYGTLENMGLFGILVCIIAKFVISRILPSAAILFNSITGFIIQDGVIAFSLFVFYRIANNHVKDILVTDDRITMVERLLDKKSIKNFVRVMGPKGTKRRICDRNLKLTFSKKSVDAFSCEKFLYAFVAGIFILAVILVSPGLERSFVESYTRPFDMMADMSAYEDKDGNVLYTKEDIIEMDDQYMNLRRQGMWEQRMDTDIEEISAFIKEHMPTLSTMQLQEQITRVEAKYQKLNNIHYHFYYLFLIYIFGFIAYSIPDKLLKKRLKVAAEEEEEEFLQLQIITMILASMNFDTLEALGHLARISEIHKDTLTYCYYSYASDPYGALSFVEKQSQSENFKQYIGKLKETISELSIKEAFSDLKSDREHICNERIEYIKHNINQKRTKDGFLAMLPINAAIYGMMVFPLLYTGFTGLTESVNQLTSL